MWLAVHITWCQHCYQWGPLTYKIVPCQSVPCTQNIPTMSPLAESIGCQKQQNEAWLQGVGCKSTSYWLYKTGEII